MQPLIGFRTEPMHERLSHCIVDDLPVTTPAEALEHASHCASMHLLGEGVGAGTA
jgi:hypothetical protein